MWECSYKPVELFSARARTYTHKRMEEKIWKSNEINEKER